MAKETYFTHKRDLQILTYLRYAKVSKETYYKAKETYYKAKEAY